MLDPQLIGITDFLGGEGVAFEKDIKILISHDLSWNKHVDLSPPKLKRFLTFFYRTCEEITDVRTKKLLFDGRRILKETIHT